MAVQLDRPAGNVDAQRARRDHLVAVLALVGRQLRPPQQRTHTASELVDRERLRDVVVRAELEPDDLVELVVAGSQHDDRDGAARPQALADLEPVEVREHDVEHDEVWILLAEPVERLFAVPRRHDPESIAFERVREELLNGVLVVDEQDGRWLGHVAGLPGDG